MPLRCKICGQFMKDGWSHALRGSAPDGTGFMSPKDKAHAKAMGKFAEALYEGDCPICGHPISRWVSGGSDGDVSWEITCSGCDFLWDED